jgi:hypothetical protein
MPLSNSFDFIFIEASAKEEPSFPAELYWGTVPGEDGASYLVNPDGISRWENWSAEFFDHHLITHSDLKRYGTHPSRICDAIGNDLSGKTVYAKDVPRTHSLITELFLAIDRPVCDLLLGSLDDFWVKRLNNQFAGCALDRLEEIKREVADQHQDYTCGGAFERLYYLEVWKAVLQSGRA